MSEERQPSLGCTFLGNNRCEFLVWAPRASKVEIHLLGPEEKVAPMQPQERGYHYALLGDVEPGSLYFFRMHDKERPDPASRFQPHGAHGPSAVVDSRFHWTDNKWKGLRLDQLVFYELHVGAFTPEGTLDAIHARLEELVNLGVTAIELMPVAQFPGSRNWGYDGVYPFAVQNSYGGPPALKRLVNACHERGLAVVLDVVYNHLGPEGNYLPEFGPYFTDHYRTPWGKAINFDDADSDEVRRYFIENALYWITEFHVDGVRLDAIHVIVDSSARPFLEELGTAVHEQGRALGRLVHVIPENDHNDSRTVRPRENGGLGLDAQWCDDFHHALHSLLTRERSGYYADFGSVGHLAKALEEGFVYSGQYSAYRRRHHGNSARDVPAKRFIVFAQNHDQVGNRKLGERLSKLASFEHLKLAAGVTLLSPFLPLLFMGEEYGEEAPFLYFVDHSDPSLVEAVREGRKKEFSSFEWTSEPPDPQGEAAFLGSKLHWEARNTGCHRTLYEFYKELIRLRCRVPALTSPSIQKVRTIAHEAERVLISMRIHDHGQALAVFHFGGKSARLSVPCGLGDWSKKLDSADPRWRGDGSLAPHQLERTEAPVLTVSPSSFVLYTCGEDL